LDILPVQECTCPKAISKKILPSSLSSAEAGEFVCAVQLDVKCRAASPISFKHQALGGHADSFPDLWNLTCAGAKQMTLLRCGVPTAPWGADAL